MSTRMACIVASAAALVLCGGASALADCDLTYQRVARTADARGVTFIGTLDSSDVSDQDIAALTFDVDEPYTPRVGDSIVISANICHGDFDRLKVGHRYLVSSGGTDTDSSHMVAWNVVGQAVDLVHLTAPSGMPAAIQRVDTVAEAVALMTKSALPQTDTVEEDQGHAGVSIFALWTTLMSTAAAGFAFYRRVGSRVISSSPR